MKAIIYYLGITICLFFASCGGSKLTSTYGSPNVKQTLLDQNTFKIDKYATDTTYGYSQSNPIMVGGGNEGPLNERRFLNALTGPNGEPITYKRLRSCCQFTTKNGLFDNTGLLDMYEVAHKGLEKPVTLYINMYDSDELKIPVGFLKK